MKTLTQTAAAPLPRSKPLTERAMLVHVHISSWQARKHNQVETDAVIAKHKAQAGAARVHEALLARKALSGINIAQTNLRQYFYEQTLPWLQNGARICPAENYFGLMNGARDLIEKFEKAVADLLDNYDALVEEAKVVRGGLFNAADYPHKAELVHRFCAKVLVTPLADPSDFRITTLDDAEQARLKDAYKAELDAQVAEAMRDLWQRLFDGVKTLHDRIKDFRVTAEGKSEGVFRDSCFEHLRHLVDLLPRLNISGDAQLEAMRARIEEDLASCEPEVLRENPAELRHVVKTASAIMDAMSGYMS